MKMLVLLVCAVYMAAAQRQSLGSLRSKYIGTSDCTTCFTDEMEKHFSDKFSCLYDQAGVFSDFLMAFYDFPAHTTTYDDPVDGVTYYQNHYCCGIMANGLKQCDLFDKWSVISETFFSLCETDAETAFSETNSDGTPKLRRDLCCENNHFSDCSRCKSFMVWDSTVYDVHGGDGYLETELDKTKTDGSGKVTASNDYKTDFNAPENQNRQFSVTRGGTTYTGAYPPYAYTNQVFPLGYARGRLREFSDPPICVYAPNTAGRVIEIRVEPDEIGNSVCVDDLHEDSLERNNPGVTQACDDTRLRTCFPDASTDDAVDGFAFLITCEDSCADADVDMWFRLRASTNKWTEAGDASLGTDRTELNTEMWCMWGVSDMRAEDGSFSLSDDPTLTFDGLSNLDGDFSKWDRWPSNLTPEREPRVQPYESSVGMLSLSFAFIVAAFAF